MINGLLLVVVNKKNLYFLSDSIGFFMFISPREDWI